MERHLKKGVYGIILASGQSIRMGKPKLLLPWKGISLLEHTLMKMVSIPFDGVKIVIPDENDHFRRITSSFACNAIYNSASHFGMGHSLSLAFQSLPLSAEAAVIVLGDQPLLDSEDIKKVLFDYEQKRVQQKSCLKMIMRMKYCDGRAGHPILISHHFFNEFISLKGDEGGKAIIQKNIRYLHHSQSRNVYPNDIDTPEDYKQLVKEECCE